MGADITWVSSKQFRDMAATETPVTPKLEQMFADRRERSSTAYPPVSGPA